MTIPGPSTDTIEQSRRALAKVQSDMDQRRKDRAALAQETGYAMFAPGFF